MKAGIDKLNAYLHETARLTDVEKRAKALGLEIAPERIGSTHKHALRIGDSEGEHIYLGLDYQSSAHSKLLITNPNDFSLYKHFEDFITSLFGRNQYECLKIIRIDFNFDAVEEFHQFKKWLRTPYKKITKNYVNECGEITGIYYGKGSKVIYTYDKAEELRSKGHTIATPLTRVEARYTGRRVPVEFGRDLPNLVRRGQHGHFIKAFNEISVEPITLVPFDSLSKEKDRLLWTTLNTSLEIGGYDAAYKYMNKNGNFKRDFRRLVTFGTYPCDLNQVLLDHLCDFFGRPRMTYGL